MRSKKKSSYVPTGILLFIGILLVVLLFVFVIPFIKFENTLAIQTPQHISNQTQKRQETYVQGDQISTFVKKAAVASQDKRFYSNLGIDIFATMRAVYFTVATGNRQGASTITEQLAKNVYYHDNDTFKTDIETKVLALFITLHFSKDKILEMYLNDIYYGKGAYGISAASALYFHTTPRKLTLSQSAYLLGLINAPSYLTKHPAQALQVTKRVLQSMQNNSYISKQQASNSLSQLSVK